MPYFRIIFLIFLYIHVYPTIGSTLQPAIVSKHFSAVDGLGTKTVYSVVQDPDGFIWFGTDAGAYRYDGNEFKRYTIEDGLSDNEILYQHVDSKGRVWFLTYNGYLSFYYKGVIYNSSNAPFLKQTYLAGSYVNALEENGKIWFASLKRGFVCIEDTVVSKIILPVKDRELSYPFIFKSKDDSLWIFKNDTLINLINRNAFKIKGYPRATFAAKGFSDVFVLTSMGVYRLKNTDLKPYLEVNNLPDPKNVISILYEPKLDNLWICTLGKGCTLFQRGKFVKTYLSNVSVTNVYRDIEGNIWMSTMSDGVYVFYQNNNYILNYNKSSGLSDNKVFSIALDSKNNIWAGFNNAEINKIDRDQKEEIILGKYENADYLRTLSIVPSGDTIWCANDEGMFFINGRSINKIIFPVKHAYTKNYSVKHLMIDSDRNVYGSFSFNLLKVNKSKPVYFVENVLDSITRVFSSAKSEDGVLFISTLSGLIEYVPGKYLKTLSLDYDFSKARILDMKFDRYGELIVSTNINGIFILKDSRVIQHITTAQGLSDNSCRKVLLEDSLLYICTQNGLNIFSRDNGKWNFKDKINIRDGLLDNSINDIATNDSMIYLATDGGISIVNKRVFNISHYVRKIYISEVILDKPYNIKNGRFEVRSDVQSFIVKFSYPVYNPANKIRVKYRLRKNNENSTWLNTSNNEIQFSSLEPGEYIFETLPYLSNQSTQVSSLIIDVLPQWWQTITARAIFIFIILFGIILSVKQWTRMQFEKRLRSLKEKEAIEAERNRIASDMHDDIGADLTQISIWSNVLKNNSSNGENLVLKISQLSNDVLSKMDQIIWALNSAHTHSTDLITYIHSYSAEYLEENQIDLKFEFDNNIPDVTMSASKRRNIFLVMKELLHNTVKHSGATEVKIRIYLERNCMVIAYSDNGKGIQSDIKSFGMGMATMEQRMNEINSKILFDNDSKGIRIFLKINLREESVK